MLRIAMITSSPLPPREGVGFYAWNLASQLVRQGHRVHVIARGDTRSLRRSEVEGITVWRPTFWPVYPWQAHLHGLFVDNLIKDLEPELDLLHVHSPLTTYPKTKLPTLVTVHTPMKAHAGSFPAGTWFGCLVKLQALASQGLERELFECADKLTAVAHSVVSEMSDYGVAPEKVSVLGNGVDTDAFSPNPNRAATDQPYVLTVARLGLRKGLEDLIQCAEVVVKQFPTHRFCIAGAGPLESALRAEIARRQLQGRVVLLGHIDSRSRLAELYRGAELYVHPAHYEGLPTSLLEAMACARPVVATAVSGALDVLQDGQNGLLVPPRQPSRMAQSVIRVLQKPELGDLLGRAGRETIETRYSWNVVGGNYLEEYERLLSDHQ